MKARAKSGFTIIEVIAAMLILVFGMTTILGLLSFGASMTRTARLRGESAQAIEAILADLEENLFPLILVDGDEVIGEPEEFEGRPVPGHARLSYSTKCVPGPDPPGPGVPREWRVDVEIAWNVQGARRTRSFTTLMAQEIPFGEKLRRRFVEGLEPEEAPSEAQTLEEKP